MLINRSTFQQTMKHTNTPNPCSRVNTDQENKTYKNTGVFEQTSHGAKYDRLNAVKSLSVHSHFIIHFSAVHLIF